MLSVLYLIGGFPLHFLFGCKEQTVLQTVEQLAHAQDTGAATHMHQESKQPSSSFKLRASAANAATPSMRRLSATIAIHAAHARWRSLRAI